MKSSFIEKMADLRKIHPHLSQDQAFDIVLNDRIIEEQIRVHMNIDNWFDYKAILEFYDYTGFLLTLENRMMGIPTFIADQQQA